MRPVASVGCLILACLVACTHLRPSPPPTAAGTVSQASAPPEEPAPAEQSTKTQEAAPPATTAKAPASSTGSPPAKPPAPSPTGSPPAKGPTANTAMPKTPRGDSTAKIPPAGERAAAPVNQAVGGNAPVRPPAAPSLDLASLEQRLRDTHAIGVFTKLSLKNQVDDLLAAVRTFHGGRLDPPLAVLRQRYDLLLLKVLTLLQDGDPSLASAISASRETIWGILADREKFQKIQLG
jgi:hypothetical protein